MKKIVLLILTFLLPVLSVADSTFYTYGNAPMMYGVFNSIAMIFNNSSFGSAVETVFTMSFAVAVAISIFGKRWDFAKYGLISLFILSLFFWQRDSVIINDVSIGDVHVVDDVPYGYAYLGELVSSFGYFITDSMDTAFAVPTTDLLYGRTNDLSSDLNYKNAGIAGAYKNLELIRSIGFSDPELKVSFNEYVKKCFKWEYYGMNTTIKAAFARNADLFGTDALKSTFDIPVTIGGIDSNCKDYYTSYLKGWIATDALDKQNKLLSESKLTNYYSGGLTSALAQFTSMSYSLNDAMMQSALLKASVKGLADGFYADDNEQYYQFLAEYGIGKMQQQGNVLARFGNEVMPVFRNFMEVFIIAALPIVLLLFILPNSFKIIGNYFQSLIWIQLWNPILAIINYVIVMAGVWKSSVMFELGNLQPGLTLENLSALAGFTDTYIAIAGYMTLSVPVLATVILSGGKWASGALAGTMAGAGMQAAALTNPQAMDGLANSHGISNQIKQWNESGVDQQMLTSRMDQAGFQYESQAAQGNAMNQMIAETGKSSWSIQNTNARSQAIDAHAKAVGVQKTAEALGGTTSYVDGVSETNSFNQRAGIAETKDLKDNGFTPERVGSSGAQAKMTGVVNSETKRDYYGGNKEAAANIGETGALEQIKGAETTKKKAGDLDGNDSYIERGSEIDSQNNVADIKAGETINRAFNTRDEATNAIARKKAYEQEKGIYTADNKVKELGDGDQTRAAKRESDATTSKDLAYVKASELKAKYLSNGDMTKQKINEDLSNVSYTQDGRQYKAAMDENGDIVFKDIKSGQTEAILNNYTENDLTDIKSGSTYKNTTYDYEYAGGKVKFGKDAVVNMLKTEEGRRDFANLTNKVSQYGESEAKNFNSAVAMNLNDSLSSFGNKSYDASVSTGWVAKAEASAGFTAFGNGAKISGALHGSGKGDYEDGANIVTNSIASGMNGVYEQDMQGDSKLDKNYGTNMVSKLNNYYDSYRNEFETSDNYANKGMEAAMEAGKNLIKNGDSNVTTESRELVNPRANLGEPDVRPAWGDWQKGK